MQYKKRYGCSKGKLMGRGGYFFVALSLRYDIGMPSELSSAKMERVLASLRVQSYNAKKRNPNFLQICGISKAQNDENENTRLIMGRQ